MISFSIIASLYFFLLNRNHEILEFFFITPYGLKWSRTCCSVTSLKTKRYVIKLFVLMNIMNIAYKLLLNIRISRAQHNLRNTEFTYFNFKLLGKTNLENFGNQYYKTAISKSNNDLITK